jgi:hypothetical protein
VVQGWPDLAGGGTRRAVEGRQVALGGGGLAHVLLRPAGKRAAERTGQETVGGALIR